MLSTQTANEVVSFPSFSPDGRFLAFLSSATNLDTSVSYVGIPVVGGPPVHNAFVYDTTDGAIDLVSRSFDNLSDANADVFPSPPAISRNGRQVAYATWATNISDANVSAYCAETPIYLVFTDLDSEITNVFSFDNGCPYFFPPILTQDGRFFVVASSSGVIAYPDWPKVTPAPTPTPQPNPGAAPSSTSSGGGGQFDNFSLLAIFLLIVARAYRSHRRNSGGLRGRAAFARCWPVSKAL
jgi:hypothetical protein